MYDPANDYVIRSNPKFEGRPFEPTTEDPLCARCGWPKHHHTGGPDGGGTGALATGLTEDTCDGFRPLALTAAQRDRSQEILRVMRAPVVVETPGLIRAIRKLVG
jgi:hypothetical protein